MPSMFGRTTKKLVKEIGDQELRPVKCLVSATKIRRFSLIQRKKACSRFWQLPDVPLDVSLMHILEPGSSVPDAAVEVSADFSDTEVMKQQAAGSVNAGAEAGFSEETAVCRGSSLEYQIVSTPHETWTELQKRKLPDPEPYFLKQCREAGVNLYVVTETVELRNSPVLQDHSSMNISGKFSIPLNIFVKGEGQGGGLKVREKKLTVPKGSVVAYKRKQLVFKEKDWGIHHIADDDDRETFPAGFKIMRKSDEQVIFLGGMDPAAPPMGGMGTPTLRMAFEDMSNYDEQTISLGADFKLLQEEVSQNVKAAELSKDMQNVVFSNLLAMLGDREALQDLMDTLEHEPFGHLDGPGGTILTELQKDSCYPGVVSKCLILYLLETLMVLSDIQHVLLAQSMEKRILLPQRDLVRSILEPNFNCSENIPFTLQPELLAPLQGKALAITYGLLDECGLKMEVNSPGSTWDPEAQEPLSALYGALSVLSQLAEA
ncbi:gasdermin-C isoform X1 [Myotis daubentonii]|uniref:gasdermin-C isoform X1 n=1 Tax=Myotis daubentonii TaxID=98922 RepID=UPI0028737E1E|nr:gasdermin-C isoform X1 [Myotis daubentonii]XP_059528270.1 gasdermin-C isoform X1 [Myotis daubentonii]